MNGRNDEEVEKWAKSEARALLYTEIVSGEITLEMHGVEVRNTRNGHKNNSVPT